MNNMELGPIRPPSEAESMMLRVTRGATGINAIFVIYISNINFQEEVLKRLRRI